VALLLLPAGVCCRRAFEASDPIMWPHSCVGEGWMGQDDSQPGDRRLQLRYLPRRSFRPTQSLTVSSMSGWAAGRDWHVNKTKQMSWAASYCRCEGCDGFNEGNCTDCVISQKELLEADATGTADCDAYPPQYACWMNVRTRSSGWPIYDSGVRVKPLFTAFFFAVRLRCMPRKNRFCQRRPALPLCGSVTLRVSALPSRGHSLWLRGSFVPVHLALLARGSLLTTSDRAFSGKFHYGV